MLLRFRYDRTQADDGFRCDADIIGVRRDIWIVSIASEESAFSVLIGFARQIKRVFFCDKTTQSLKFFLGHAWLILRNRTLTGAQENKQRYDQAFFRRVIQLLSIVIRMNFIIAYDRNVDKPLEP